MNLSWQIVRLHLKETFSISYGDYSFREALIVKLSDYGTSGYGECTGIDYYNISLSDFDKTLHRLKDKIEKQQIQHPIDFYNFLIALELPSFLRSALDCAYWDLFGKLENRSFSELNNIEVYTLPESSITISVAPIETQLDKIAKSSWNKFKVKCNHFNEEEVQMLLQTGKSVALDANGSYSPEECQWLENLEASKGFTYVEQPMKPGEENFKSLQSDQYPNWMADEDCQENIDLKTLQPHYRSINIKLVKCGGLTPALELIKNARNLDFKIMIGCMTESTIGISAGAALVPLVDFVDLDGANLISNDLASGSKIEFGKVLLSEQPGLGIRLL
ncbi:chloromuconate cycloisomerase YkfB1 [Flavobacterium cauense R2A-7]|uniref:L-alanine-DL-glutamate epimerase-like enolase superfamily enzyme n=1 Tax=Flavobacterium cauense R2A-7 TaxID=1341154 RepID=V6RWR0_9FLAO|nr:enolase C-terminal domain-like protein [Flavobacterium cauense]ESU18913.1 chloromuconate cycloisomerase YkfB1 [Flavobacterium cauense R2A-7]KGO82449.1 chloromuconate cycloisomerase [Flavobacterium cauense R2A-7]TWI15428.1 L-alanine-DL-glutamate epimerase-like enolase superfamily enzyme [Flavobacterium cauense R2A-7]